MPTASSPIPPRSARRWQQCQWPASNAKEFACTDEQRAEAFKLAEQLHGGAALRLTPCELHAYLRGRTLWLIGCAC